MIVLLFESDLFGVLNTFMGMAFSPVTPGIVKKAYPEVRLGPIPMWVWGILNGVSVRTIVHLDNRTLNNINGGYNPFSLPTCEIDCPLTMTDLELTKKRDTDICTNACE